MCSVDDMHFNIAVRRTIMVVGTIHVAEDGGTHIRITQLGCIADIDLGIAIGIVSVAAHVGKVGAAEHVALHRATQHIHAAVAVSAASQVVGSPQIARSQMRSIGGVVHDGCTVNHLSTVEDLVVATVAAAEHATEVVLAAIGHGDFSTDGAAIDGDRGVTGNGTLLSTAEHFALDGTAVDDDLGRSRTSHRDPVG